MRIKMIKHLPKLLILFFLILGLTLSYNVATSNACAQPGFGYACDNNPFSFFTGFMDDRSDFGSIAAVGTFFFPTDYSGGAGCLISSAGDSTRWALSSVEDAEIHLYAEQTGMFFDWAAGAIYDTYAISGYDISDVYVSVGYEGTLSQNAALVLGLMGDQGFKVTGMFGPDTFGERDTWQVKLSDIVSTDDGTFKMALGAAVLVMGEGSSAVFANFSDTINLTFTTSQGGSVGVTSEGGFTEVPIPGTVFLFVPGVIGIFAFRRKKA